MIKFFPLEQLLFIFEINLIKKKKKSSHLNKNGVRFAHDLLDFSSFWLFVLNFAMKLKDANCKSHWNILVFCEQGKVMSDLSMSHGKISNFDSFP